MSHEDNHEEFDRHEVEVEFPAEHGDLVSVDGYPARIFRVDAYRVEINYYPAEEFTDVVYELTDVINSEWLEADADELTVLADAGQADEYVRSLDRANYPKSADYIIGMDAIDFLNKSRGGNNMYGSKPQEPRKPTARELSAQVAEERKAARKARAEQIDNLLDRRNWYAEQLAKTNDESYCDKIMQVDAELKMLAEVDV